MSKQPSLTAQLNYMYQLERFGIKLGLEVMTELLRGLGNPHEQFRSIHITGTNGKGSTASFLNAILSAADLKVGMYTSPHLYRFNERIQVNGKAITDRALSKLIARVRTTSDELGLQPTFFEFTTALAFLYFAKTKVDIAVIEVGMGGTLDATNVITPLVSVITNVGLDHVGQIGNNRREIAANKAGVIKPGIPVVTAETDPKIISYFKKVCRRQHAILRQVQQDLKVSARHATLRGQTFILGGTTKGKFAIKLLGRHQITNACTALLTTTMLAQQGIKVPASAVTRGLAKAQWEGRLDIVSRRPFILVDGAHNNDGALSLKKFLDEAALPVPHVLIVAQKKGKKMSALFKEIAPRFATVVVTEGNYEPAPAHGLAKAMKKFHPNVVAIRDVKQAVTYGLSLLDPKKMMLVTGSLYMVGDALKTLKRKHDKV